MSIIEDIGLAGVILGDVENFAAGNPVSATQKVGNLTLSVTAQKLPNGPVAPFTPIGGSIFAILGMVLADATAIASGAPVSIAEKIGNTWYGETIQVVPSQTK